MWLLAVALVLYEVARAYRARRKTFDQFELDVIYLFARIWHAAAWNRPAPVPLRGPAILVANHTSLADPAFLIASCPRLIHFLQAKECYEVPLLRYLFRRAGCIPVARDGKDIAALRQALNCLRRGAVLGIFPEGEVYGKDSVPPSEARHGVAFLALHGRVPVIPAYIAGGRATRNPLEAWLRPTRRARVIYGEPIDLSAYYGRRVNRAVLAEVTELMMRRVAELGRADLGYFPAAIPSTVIPNRRRSA
jgi:1-acyl-sn-glycerol-3-phosphate acyltransferase